MNCPDCLELVQRQLDGAPVPEGAALDEHLAGCRDCREWSAATRCLAEGLRTLPPPLPPVGLVDRVVGGVLRQGRARLRRRRWLMGGAAAAAALLVASFAGYLWPRLPAPGPPEQMPQPVVKNAPRPETSPPAPLSLRESVAEARSAVAALTEDLAAKTKAQARVLLSAAAPLDAMSVPQLPEVGGLEQPLEPAAQSVRASGHGVSASLETVTGSARRAFTYFLHQLPLETERKTGL
jgi:predicted anti-sigma-YlaC factor YlaD